jgi:hypothetical protein
MAPAPDGALAFDRFAKNGAHGNVGFNVITFDGIRRIAQRHENP